MKSRITSVLPLIAVLVFLWGGIGNAAPSDSGIFDFDDCTLQGWTPEPSFGGTLFADCTGGNPDGFMVATDTVSGGGALYARAPAPFQGDLSGFAGVQWDAFVYDNGTTTVGNTSMVLRGVDGTSYESSRTLGPIAVWTTHFVPFDDPTAWTQIEGTASFTDVLTQVEAVFVSMDTSIRSDGVRESGVDNVTLVQIIR